MARVNVESKALADHRIRLLAKRLGVDYQGALGRLVFVWHACVEIGAHVLRPEDIDAAADTDGMAAAMVQAGLGREEANGVYVAGTQGRIEWLAQFTETRRAGGKKRAELAKRERGRFVSSREVNASSTSSSPAVAGGVPPARASALTLTPTPEDLRSGDLGDPDVSANPDLPGINCPAGAGRAKAPAAQKAQKVSGADHRKLVASYFELFAATHGGTKPRFGEVEGKQAKELLAAAGLDDCADRLGRLFSADCPAWIVKGGRDWKSFVFFFDKLAKDAAAGANGSGRKTLSAAEIAQLAESWREDS